jgi:glycosyltransferase involved in cell wall biosynthesis
MKIVYISRAKNPIFFSIERVFDLVIKLLPGNWKFYSLGVPNHGFNLKNLLYIFKRAQAADKDSIFHITGDITYTVVSVPRQRTVLTIHDLGFLQQYKGIKRVIIKWLYIDMPVKRSAIITTISEKSKQEIIEYTKCNEEKVVVIPNPVSNTIYYIEKDFNTLQPRFLFIGSTPNKNLERVIMALNGIPCFLRIVGRISEEQKRLLEQYFINYSEVSGITEQELNEEYRKSDIVIFPSLYEGFGLPIIEAQKAGRVVITSNISPMKEISGGASCIVDPYSVESIKKGILQIIHNENYRNDLLHKGFYNVERFSPRKITDQYIDLYRTLEKKLLSRS